MDAPGYVSVAFGIVEGLLIFVCILGIGTWWWGDSSGLSVFRDFFKRGED